MILLARHGETEDNVPPQRVQGWRDVPLNERKLRQIVRFSVLPYVRELLTMQFGKPDTQLLAQIEELLLQCLSPKVPNTTGDAIDGERQD